MPEHSKSAAHQQSSFMSEEARALSPEEFWNSFYARQDRVWSGQPNPGLVREVSDLPPGEALDLGCGEGADAVWLAGQGWSVTGVDISPTALERCAHHADLAGVSERTRWERHDLSVTFPAGQYDLVSAQFLHAPVDLPREEILRRAADAVRPGGTLLIVGHTGVVPWAQDDPHGPCFPTPAQTLQALELPEEQWKVMTDEVHECSRTTPTGETVTRTDHTLALRRL